MKYKRLILLLALTFMGWLFIHEPSKAMYFVSFEEAQEIETYSPLELINFHQKLGKKKWRIVHRLYKRNLAGRQKRRKKEKIPKIIHQIWLNGPIPEKIALLQETWKKQHPGWDYHLWTKEDIDLLYLQNKELYDQQTDPAKKEEIVRFEILYQFGGIFIDNEYECIASLDILHENCDFFAPLTTQIRTPRLCSNLIASVPKHPILRKTIQKMHTKQPVLIDLSIILTESFFETAKKNSSLVSIALPATFFYVLPDEEITPRAYTFGLRRKID